MRSALPQTDSTTSGTTSGSERRAPSLSELEIRLFGTIEVRAASRPLPHLRSRKGLWLLALLILRSGRDVDRDWLAGMLWPDDDETHGRRSLRQSLHDLRLALGTEGNRLSNGSLRTLHLDLENARVDVLAFRDAVSRAERNRDADAVTAALEEAVQLYRGPLLEGCTEEWAAEERRRLEQDYIRALSLLAAGASTRGDHPAAVSYLRLAASADPYREDLHRSLMEALAAGGNPAEALLVYRRFRELLRGEMAAEPSRETTVVFHTIRDSIRSRSDAARIRHPASPAQQSSPPAEAPVPALGKTSRAGAVPLPLTELIGREHDVREAITRLASTRLLTLTGAGGIGKTRLGLRVAEEVEGAFEHGIRFVSLASLADGTRLGETVCTALLVPQGNSREDALGDVVAYLAPRSMLLVLDNCEHVAEPCAALVHTILAHCSGIRILATSRQALALPGEVVWRVPSLSLPPADECAWLAGTANASESSFPEPRDDGECPAVEAAEPRTSTRSNELPSAVLESTAVQLFVERARAVRAGFALTPGNAAAVSRVCRRVDGIPLAIELAAARVRSMPIHQIAARLSDSFRLLSSDARGVIERHQTLTATFDWSWALLNPAQRSLLGRLSAFAGGCTLEAAEAVCGETGDTEIIDLLTSLVDRSLVIYDEDDGSGPPGRPRYHMLEPVRQYAAEQLRSSDESDATYRRHCDYFLEWAEEIKPRLWDVEQAVWYRQLEVDHDNLRAAVRWSRENDEVHKELRLAVALSRFWDTYGHLREGRTHVESAVRRMGSDLPPLLRTHALIAAGWMAFTMGDHETARTRYESARALFPEHGDLRAASTVLNLLALVRMEEGAVGEARALYEELLVLRNRAGLMEPPVLTMAHLGHLAIIEGDYESARCYLDQAIAGYHRSGMPQGEGLSLLNLAAVDCAEGRHAHARSNGTTGLMLLHRCGAVVDIPASLDQMALLACGAAEWERAARLLGAAHVLREKASVPLTPHLAAQRATTMADVERSLGGPAFTAAFADGAAMDLERAVAFAAGNLWPTA